MSVCCRHSRAACSSRQLLPQHSGLPPAATNHRCMAASSPDEGGRSIEVCFWPHRSQTVRAPLGGEVEWHKTGQTRMKATSMSQFPFLLQSNSVRDKIKDNSRITMLILHCCHTNILMPANYNGPILSRKLALNTFEVFEIRNAYFITDSQREDEQSNNLNISQSLYEVYRCHL